MPIFGRNGDFARQLGKHRRALFVLRALAVHDVLELGMTCHGVCFLIASERELRCALKHFVRRWNPGAIVRCRTYLLHCSKKGAKFDPDRRTGLRARVSAPH